MKDTPEMVERVARAIAESALHHGGWQELVPEARAAIEAFREPTEEMIERGRKAPVNHSWGPATKNDTGEHVCDPETILDVMIDAALGKAANDD